MIVDKYSWLGADVIGEQCNTAMFVALREGRRQRYGTQLKWDDRIKGYQLAPLEDPDHVDQRRQAIGLSPLGVYLAQWGLTWDVERYKRENP
jgi:hypothetical protein